MSVNQKPLRVLLVTPRYFPLMGGVETHVYEVARRFAAKGVETTVLTTDPSGELTKEDRVEGVNIVRVKAYPRDRDYYFAPQLYGKIVGGKWDIIHCQSFHTLVPPIAMLSALRSRVPYVVSFHSGGHSASYRNSARSLQASILKPLLSRAKKLIAVSHFEAELFQQRLGLPQDRFTVVPNGSHLPKITPIEVDRNHDPMILSVGRLEHYKGHHRLIEAFPQILQHRPDAHLRILGQGPHEAELKQMAVDYGVADRTEIGAIPPSNRTGMADILSQASLVTLLSDYEAHPIAVMEALSMKRPVLVTHTSGLGELADRGLVTSIPLDSSSTQVAEAVLNQLEHPMIPADFELPTWDQCADALLAVYHDVLRR
jgi:glycogen synthase